MPIIPSYKIVTQSSDKQLEAYAILKDYIVKFLLFGGAAYGGKSWLGCEWEIMMCSAFPDLRYFIGRKELTKLKRTTLVTFFEVCRFHGLIPEVHYKYNAQNNTITFWNGSLVQLLELKKQPSDPLFEDLGSSEYTGGFIDETGQIDFMAFDVLKSRVGRWKNALYNIPAKLLMSCNPTKNWLYTVFYKRWKKGRLPKGYAFIQSLHGDNINGDPKYASQLDEIENRATKQRLKNGIWEFDDDEACLMDFDKITEIYSNPILPKSEEKYIIGDVARKGRDKWIVGYWEGLVCREIHKLPFDVKKDTVKAAKWLKEFAKKKGVMMSNVLVDEGGVGGGVVDMLKCKGFISGARPIQPRTAQKDPSKMVGYGNLRAQCYDMLANKVNHNKIKVIVYTPEVRDEINEELEQIKQKDFDKDGKIYMIPKDEIKNNLGRSPDYADMLMMRMFFSLKPKRRLLITTLND